MKLKRYLKINEIDREDFAERVGVSLGTIQRLCGSTGYLCSPPVARRIISLCPPTKRTEGVTYEDLYGAPDHQGDQREQLSTQAQ